MKEIFINKEYIFKKMKDFKKDEFNLTQTIKLIIMIVGGSMIVLKLQEIINLLK